MGSVIEREETPPTLGVQAGLWGYPLAYRVEAFPKALAAKGIGHNISARSIGSRRPMISSSYSEQLTYFDNHGFKKDPTSGCGHLQVFESAVPYRDW